MQPAATSLEPIAWTAWLLQATRLVRSVWQGALVVDFALYLKALAWSAVQISVVLSAALLLGAMLTMLLGPLSDRFGRRRFLLVYDAAQGLAALVAWWTPAALPLAMAAVVGGFGRGGNGAAGPFSPVEQAWMAQCVPASRRGMFYSLNAALGFFGMAIGAVLAGAPGWAWGAAPPAAAYRPLFLLTAVLSAVTFVMIAVARDDEAGRGKVLEEDPRERVRENGLVRRLVLANLLNGAGLGLSGPLVTYWFALKFNHGPASIGAMMAVGFVLAGVASLLAGRLSRRVGVVRAVVLMRLVGLVLLVALPFAGSFMLASVLYVARAVMNRGTTGARSAVNMGIVRANRRGFSSAASNVALQVPRAIGPVFAGALFQSGFLAAPFLVAAVFQAGYVWVYDRSFRGVELK
jgi:MFS family permease